eukprot:jgi/Mesvir1/872/Mv25682-RA.1
MIWSVETTRGIILSRQSRVCRTVSCIDGVGLSHPVSSFCRSNFAAGLCRHRGCAVPVVFPRGGDCRLASPRSSGNLELKRTSMTKRFIVQASGGVSEARMPAGASVCRNCKRTFDAQDNGPQACRYHTQLYTGGETSKFIGFLRTGFEKDQQLPETERGLKRFWDCCGATDPDSPGCVQGHHVAFGDI